MPRRRSTWKRGDCTICLLHQRYFIWPMPRWVFWHQHGRPPLNLDFPDPSDLRDHWGSDEPYDEWHDLEPVDMPHYNRQQRKRRKVV